MAFQFRLQSVLIFRTSLEEKAQLTLALEQRRQEEHRRRLVQLRDDRLAMMASFEERKREGMTAGLYTLYVEGLLVKEQEIVTQIGAMESQRQVVEACRQELARRMQDRKVIERLKEKDFQLFLAGVRQREQKQSDEQAILRYGKGML
jgi:flagellar protein FliJ